MSKHFRKRGHVEEDDDNDVTKPVLKHRKREPDPELSHSDDWWTNRFPIELKKVRSTGISRERAKVVLVKDDEPIRDTFFIEPEWTALPPSLRGITWFSYRINEAPQGVPLIDSRGKPCHIVPGTFYEVKSGYPTRLGFGGVEIPGGVEYLPDLPDYYEKEADRGFVGPFSGPPPIRKSRQKLDVTTAEMKKRLESFPNDESNPLHRNFERFRKSGADIGKNENLFTSLLSPSDWLRYKHLYLER